MSKILTKTPNESYIYTIVFEKNMDQGETITSIDALTATPAGLTVGSPEAPLISGQSIQFRVSGGVDKQSYSITALVTTSLGNKLEHDVILNVRGRI